MIDKAQRLEDSSIERVSAVATELGYAVIPVLDRTRLLLLRLIPTTDKYDTRLRRSNSNGWYIDCEAIDYRSKELKDITDIFIELDSLKDKIIHAKAKEKKLIMQNTKPEFINDYETIKASEYVINKNLKVISDIMYKYTKEDSPSIIIDGNDKVFFYAGEDHNELVFVIEDNEESKSFVFDDRKIDLISDFKLEYLTTISRLLGESVKKWISDFADFKVDPKVDREEVINEMEAATHGTRIMIKIISDIVSKYQ